VLHNVPPVEVLELRAFSLIVVPLICCLEHHDIVGFALPVRGFLVVDLIEHGHLLFVGRPMIFQVLWSSLPMRLVVVVVCVSYDTP
jgi:hypothetical protein